MKKALLITCCLALGAAMCVPPEARAAAWVEEGAITVPAGVGTVTNTPALSAAFLEIDRIAVYSELSVTSAVHVAAKDFGLYQPMETLQLGAADGTNAWPVKVASGAGYTNVLPWTVKDLRFIRDGPTNAVDAVIRWRAFGRR